RRRLLPKPQGHFRHRPRTQNPHFFLRTHRRLRSCPRQRNPLRQPRRRLRRLRHEKRRTSGEMFRPRRPHRLPPRRHHDRPLHRREDLPQQRSPPLREPQKRRPSRLQHHLPRRKKRPHHGETFPRRRHHPRQGLQPHSRRPRHQSSLL